MKKVLVYYTSLTDKLGGGDFLPLLLVAELQKSCDVTLALNWKSDVGQAARTLEVSLDMSRLKLAILKPRIGILQKIDSILPVFTTWGLKKLAKNVDVCISTANPVDFGRPSHHFVYVLRRFGDNAFHDYLRHAACGRRMRTLFQRVKTAFAEAVLRPLLGVRSTRRILADPRERIYSTSRYVQNAIGSFYGRFNGVVFYPPVTFTPKETGTPRDPLKTVYLGQLFPYKRIEEVIEIVEKARKISGAELTLAIAGPMRDTPYVAMLKRLAAEREWLSMPGSVYGDAKSAFLMSASFAVHAERDEAFGISVTEYLKAGIVPIVPDEGGTPEIVASDDLAYRDCDGAAAILARLATDSGFRNAAKWHCAARAQAFSMKDYFRRQKELLDEILRQ